MDDVKRLARRIWPGRHAELTPLGGGITNRNVLATLEDGQRFVLRLGGADTHLLGIDRSVEHEASARRRGRRGRAAGRLPSSSRSSVS